MNFRISLAVFGAFSYFICNPVEACDYHDEICVKKITDNINSKISYSQIINGDPALGTETLDPVHHDVIDGNLSILKYNLNDSITTGFKDCKADNFKINGDLVSLYYDIVCPKFLITGKYEIHGRLILLPVEGKGDFHIKANKYRISIDADLKVTTGKDGKNYISLKNFKQTSEPLERLDFDFQNLFNGQKDLADEVLKFANENWHEVADEVQDPIFTAHCKKIVKNINKLLKKLPLEDLEQ